MMNIAPGVLGLTATAASLPEQSSSQQNLAADSASSLFDEPLDAHRDMTLWQRARRARQEWRAHRYARLKG
jgi:hypothetical protein